MVPSERYNVPEISLLDLPFPTSRMIARSVSDRDASFSGSTSMPVDSGTRENISTTL